MNFFITAYLIKYTQSCHKRRLSKTFFILLILKKIQKIQKTFCIYILFERLMRACYEFHKIDYILPVLISCILAVLLIFTAFPKHLAVQWPYPLEQHR